MMGLAPYWLQPLAGAGWAWLGLADTYSADLQISSLQRGKSASSCCSASSGSYIIRPPANQPQPQLTVIQNKELDIFLYNYLETRNLLYLNRKQAKSQQTMDPDICTNLMDPDRSLFLVTSSRFLDPLKNRKYKID